jgi:hypothetical protein
MLFPLVGSIPVTMPSQSMTVPFGKGFGRGDLVYLERSRRIPVRGDVLRARNVAEVRLAGAQSDG